MIPGLDSLPAAVAYALLFGLVAGETAGAILPGESTIMTAAVMASEGKLVLPAVLGIGIAAAIIGDNVGYWLGRRYGRRLWLWGRWGRERRRRWLDQGDAFFEERGAHAVFAGRWLPVARFTVAWLAGINHMRWRRFFVWNAAGGTAWVLTIGLAAYGLGNAAKNAITALGLIGLLGLCLGLLGHWLWHRRRAPAADTTERRVSAARPGTRS
jgi:membrane protein DedA with SNARE-associated domain